MLHYLTIPIITEIICFGCSILCLFDNTNPSWKVLCIYLFFTCVTEIYGVYLKTNHHANQWPYNILLVLQILVTSWFFNILFKKFMKSKSVIITGLAFLLAAYLYEIIYHDFFKFYEPTYNIMSVLFVFYSLFYFYFLLKNLNYINLKYSADFWWVAGVLFFYFGSTAVNIFRGNLTVKITPKHFLTYYIYIALNIFLYGCWSYSFICRRWLTTTSESLS